MKIKHEIENRQLMYYYKNREVILKKLREKRLKQLPAKIESRIIKLKKQLEKLK